MRSIALLLNAVAVINGKHVDSEKVDSAVEPESSGKEHKVELHPVEVPGNTTTSANEDAPAPENLTDSVPSNSTSEEFDWHQYADGDRQDWKKYVMKPGSDSNQDWMKYANTGNQTGSESTDNNQDWMKYANAGGQSPSASTDNSTNWNNGQGDNYGEPFRTKTGGDFRYKAGRDSNSTSGSWEQYSAPYMGGNETQSDSSSGGQSSNWQQYMGGNGTQSDSSAGGQSFNWQQYMGGNQSDSSSGGQSFNWQQYMGGAPSGASAALPERSPSAGGYFELEVEGKDLNITTTFGLGQGQGSNTTASGLGGGGGQQASVTAKEGKLFLRGDFINKFADIVAAQ